MYIVLSLTIKAYLHGLHIIFLVEFLVRIQELRSKQVGRVSLYWFVLTKPSSQFGEHVGIFG